MPDFIPGNTLSKLYYREAVRPLLDAHFPGLPHAAASIGTGSDVQGFDTEMSTDHQWGPSVVLFLPNGSIHLAEQIREVMSRHLPHHFRGYSTNFDDSPDEAGTEVMKVRESGLLNHHVFPTTVRAFAMRHLAYDIDKPLDAADWLTFSSQKLLEMTMGEVHHDGFGELTAFRERFHYYPHDVWLYLLSAGWQRIDQEQPLMSRAGQVGDELGSAIIGSRLVRDVMNLCFLMERHYAPYPKWFGMAFRQLKSAERLQPALWQVQTAPTWPAREAALVEACEYLAAAHNELGITAPLPDKASPFFGRPFMVIHASRFAEAICAQITDPFVAKLADGRLIGNIDQFSDSTDLRSDPSKRASLKLLYS